MTDERTPVSETPYCNALFQVHLDFHTPDDVPDLFAELDGAAMAETMKDSGIEAVAIFAKGHYGNVYYPTRFSNRHPHLGDRDLLGETVKEMNARDIRVLAYYSVCVEVKQAHRNPDWGQKDPEGNQLGVFGHWKDMCVNSPYTEELLLPQLHEMVSGYDVDGLFLDMVYFLERGCHCRYCQAAYQAEFGVPIGEGPKDDLREFQRRSIRRFLRKVRDRVDTVRDGVLVLVNGGYSLARDFRDDVAPSGRMGFPYLDVGVVESQPAWGGYHALARNCRYSRTIGIPFEAIDVRFIKHWGEWTTKPVPQLQYEAAVIAAHGGLICMGDQLHPRGRLPAEAYRRLGETSAFINERRHLILGSHTVRYCALLAPGRKDPLDGANALLSELQVQFDIIDEEGLADLSGYELLVLPETGCLSPKAIQRIETFVEGGGKLITTGDSSLVQGSGDFALANVLGVTYGGVAPYSVSYLSPETPVYHDPDRVVGGAGENGIGDPLLLKGKPITLVPGSARTVAQLLRPYTECVGERSFSHQHAPPTNDILGPAITVNDFGSGKAATVATPIFTDFWENDHVWLRDTIECVMRHLDTSPPYHVDGPASLETNLCVKGSEFLLHVINAHLSRGTGGGYPYMDRIVPLHDTEISMKVEREPGAVTLEPSGSEMEFQYQKDKGRVTFTVPRIGLHEIIRVSFP